MRYFLITLLLLGLATVSFLGQRSDTFVRPPWQVFPDMDDQEKYLPQRTSSFFEDGRADRPVPDGVVHRGNEINVKNVFAENFSADQFGDAPKVIALHTGKDAEGNPYAGIPIATNDENFTLGQAKYDMYCAVCHGVAGDGNGPTKALGLTNAADFHDPARQTTPPGKPEGAIFEVISKGFNIDPATGVGSTGMVGFADRLSPKERWAIILHIRALQHTHVGATDVATLPRELQARLKELNAEPSAQ